MDIVGTVKSVLGVRSSNEAAMKAVPKMGFERRYGPMGPIQLLRHGPQRAFNFNIMLPHPSELGSAGKWSGDVGHVEELLFNAVFGDYDMEQLEKMRYGPQVRNFAGFFDIQAVKLQFVKPQNDDMVSGYFWHWRKCICNGFYYRPKKAYAKDIIVGLLNTGGDPWLVVRLNNAFPSKYPTYSVGHNIEAPMFTDIQMSVDGIKVVGDSGDTDFS